MRFDISKYGNTSVSSFDLEELIGKDSLDAAGRAGPPGAQLTPAQFNAIHMNQLIAASISNVDGQPVVRPYTQWEQWSLRTQDFVLQAYMRLNGASKAETDDFLARSFGTPGAASSLPSSASGPGLPGT